jgi:hypothetical protein
MVYIIMHKLLLANCILVSMLLLYDISLGSIEVVE